METVTAKGDVSNAIDTLIRSRLRDYFPPPVFVGRGRAIMISILVSLVVLVIALQPAMRMKNDAGGDPVKS